MSDIEKYEDDYDNIIAVGELFSKGSSPPQISTELDIPLRDVKRHIMQFKGMMKSMARNNINIAERAAVVFEEVDHHWGIVLKEAWKNKEEAERNGSTGTVNQSLKLIADIQKERARLFKDLGAQQDAEIIAELEEARRNQEILVNILRTAIKRYPEAARFIQDELIRVTNEAEVVEIIDD